MMLILLIAIQMLMVLLLAIRQRFSCR